MQVDGLSLNLVYSLFVVLIAFGIMFGVRRWAGQLNIENVDDKVRIISTIRNIVWISGILILAFLWSPQLKTASLSLAAFAVALVIATKEIILCLVGGLLRAASRVYSVGDRISMGGVRGEVIETGFFSTKLLEIGPYPNGHGRTGSILSVPNSVLFSQSVVNDSLPGKYILHSFEILIARTHPLTQIYEELHRIVKETVAPFHEEASEHLARFRTRHQLLYPDSQVKICMYLRENGQVLFYLRFPVRETDKSRIQQQITRKFMNVYDQIVGG